MPSSGYWWILHYSMSKDVYSWRLRGDLKDALGEAARDER